VTWSFTRVPKDSEPYVQDGIPSWRGPIRDADTGDWITSHVMNQDFVAWVSQGRIADRTREDIGASDRGIIALRKRFLNDLDQLDAGEEPKGLIRDPEANRCVSLPVADREANSQGITRKAMAAHPFLSNWLTRGYPFQAGQPDDIRREFERAMGIDQ
jgi:5,5'-dehydrodivanillate O-demethylase